MFGKIFVDKHDKSIGSGCFTCGRQTLPVGKYLLQSKQKELSIEIIQQDKKDFNKSWKNYYSRIRNYFIENIITLSEFWIADWMFR